MWMLTTSTFTSVAPHVQITSTSVPRMQLLHMICFFQPATVTICTSHSKYQSTDEAHSTLQSGSNRDVWSRIRSKNASTPSNADTHMVTQKCTRPAQANKVFPFHSRTPATTVVWLERDEGEGGTDGRCPPSFLTKAGGRGETMEGWRQKERIK